MPRSDFSANHQTAASSRARGLIALVDLDFSNGAVYVTTNSVPVTANGHTYGALGDLVSIGPMRESEGVAKDKLKLSLAITNLSMLAYSIGPASVYRGRSVKIWGQMINENHVPIHDPFVLFIGTMENFEIDRTPSKDGRSKGSITMNVQRRGLERLRNVEGLRMSHAQQQVDYPGDLGLEYTESLVKTPPIWLTRAFQEV